jgi:hypothetical protein
MVRATLFALAMGSLGSSAALALPALTPVHLTAQPDRVEVKIICTVDGRCNRLPLRRPVARWVYGDGAFFGPGPYTGPGYSDHGPHWRWFPSSDFDPADPDIIFSASA